MEQNRLLYLDGLRALAIGGVVAVHSRQTAPEVSNPLTDIMTFGKNGVDLFFIISAFTLLLAHDGKTLDLLSFYARRVGRIAPMFYIGAFLNLLVYGFGPSNFAPSGIGIRQIIQTLVFMHGFSPDAINAVVPGGWSIASEAIFYALFPAVLLLVTNKARAWLAVILAFVVALAWKALAPRFLHQIAPPFLLKGFIDLNFLTHAPAFMLGILFFRLRPQNGHVDRRLGWIAILAAIGAMLLLAVSPLSKFSNPIIAAVTLGALFYGTMMAKPKLMDSRLLANLGEVSFSVYILHFFVIYVFEKLLKASDTALEPSIMPLATFSVALIVSWLLAQVTRHWIEQPVIDLSKKVGGGPKLAPHRSAPNLRGERLS